MKKNKKILISSFHMCKELHNYSYLLKKNNISYDTIIRNPVVKEKQLLKIISKYDGLICSDDEVTKKVLKKASRLKVISKWGTGIDSIDKKYALKKKIKIFNSPDAFSKSVSQLVWGMIINLTRNIFETQSEIRKDRWTKFSGILLENKYLGIIGLGSVGQQIIKTGKGFGMNVLGNDIKSINKSVIKKLKIKKVSKKNLLNKSDIVVLCVDLNKTSNKLINYKEFKLMKKNSIIINISRGPVINEKSLIKALKKGQIKSAGIDVFEKEPPNKNNPLLKMKNCLVSSHNAFNTVEQVNKVHKNTILNLIKGLK